MKVKALKRGTWPHNRIREAGEVFDYDGPTSKQVDGKSIAYLPSWMERLDAPKAEVSKPEGGKKGGK